MKLSQRLLGVTGLSRIELRIALPVVMIFLSGCGIWPDFPARNSQTGIDAVDVTTDASVVDGAVRDGTVSPTDAGSDADAFGGFHHCDVPTAIMRLTLLPVAPLDDTTRDLAFDGRGHLATVGASLTVFDSAGTPTPVALTMAIGSASGARFDSTGKLVVVTDGSLKAGSISHVTITDGTVDVITASITNAVSVAVLNDTTYFVSNRSAHEVLRVSSTGLQNTLFASPTLDPAGLAITPDGKHLFVASLVNTTIYQIDLTTDGFAMSTPRTYATVAGGGDSLAFDACGNLYLSDTSNGPIRRVAPGGGTADTLNIGYSTDAGTFMPQGIAFGHGTGFETSSLYLIDSANGQISRVDVGAVGASLPGVP